jgi:carbonic anhydrase
VRARSAHAEATRRIVQERFAEIGPRPLVARAVQRSVPVQTENLRTHPAAAADLARGDLRVHGWVYRIETGDVLAHDHPEGRFVPPAERGATPLPSLVPLLVSASAT